LGVGGAAATGVGAADGFALVSAPHCAQKRSLPVSWLPQLLQNAMGGQSPQKRKCKGSPGESLRYRDATGWLHGSFHGLQCLLQMAPLLIPYLL
jgi:hypothetical protein